MKKRLLIVNRLGLHARCAAMIAQVAQKAHGKVEISLGQERADAASMLDILTLAAAEGSRITVRIYSPKDEPVLTRIVSMVEDGFGEE